MAMYKTKEEHERCEKAAERLGVSIPGEISIVVWMLPILEELTNRLLKLEEEIERVDNSLRHKISMNKPY